MSYLHKSGIILTFISLFFLSIGCGGKGFFKMRVKRMSGTYSGEWSDGLRDEVEIEEGSSADLLIKCEYCIVLDTLKAEIDNKTDFTLEDDDIEVQIDQNVVVVDSEGEGSVEDEDLELEVEISAGGERATASFEGEKE